MQDYETTLLYCMSCTAPYASHQQGCWFCDGTVHVPVTSAEEDGTIQYYSFEEWLSVLLFVPLIQQQPDIGISIQADPDSRTISVSWTPGERVPLTIIESMNYPDDSLNDSDMTDLITMIDMEASEDAPCAICLESLVPNNNTAFNYVAQLPCHHIFHSQCVAQWLKTSPVCPFCRDSLHAHKTTRQQNV
jgi:hypothetical protein